MKSSIAYFPHGVPRTITEFGNQKIGAVKFGNVLRLLEKQRKITFKTTQSIRYLTEPIIQAWNLTSNLYELCYRILMLPGTGRQVHLAEINYLLLCHMTLWQDLIQAFKKLSKERKRGDGDDATAEDGFHALRTSCFWPINDQFIKILNQESLLEEWWKYVYKVENSIMEIIKWLGEIIVKLEEEEEEEESSSSSTPLSTTLPVFPHTMVASLFIGLVRWLGTRNKKGEAIMLSGGGGLTDDDRSELFFFF